MSVTNVSVKSANVAIGSVDSVIVNCRRRLFTCRLRLVRVTGHHLRRVRVTVCRPRPFDRVCRRRRADVEILLDKKNSSPCDGEFF